MVFKDSAIFTVTLQADKKEKLGLAFVGGVGTPITIKSVQDGSIAQEAGLYGGLQILNVNDFIFSPETTHHEAIIALTSSDVLRISVKECDSRPSSQRVTRDDNATSILEDRNIKDLSYGYRLKRTEIGTTLSVFLQKRHAKDNFHLVEKAGALWLAGWNQKEPALMNRFRVGDCILSLNGQPITTVTEADNIIETTPSGIDMLVQRVPLAAEYKLRRQQTTEDWGIQFRQNRIVDIIHGGIGWVAGIQPFSAEFDGSCCAWAVTEVDRKPVSILCRSTDVITRKVDNNNTEVVLTLQPSEFVNSIANSLIDDPHYEEFVARS